MKTIGTVLAVVLLAAIVVGAGYGLSSGFHFFSAQWRILSNDWKASLIIIATVLVLCTLFISASIRSYTRKHGLTSAGKVIAYNKFINWYSELKNNNPEALKITTFKEVKNQLVLWGNNYVVKQTNFLYEELINDQEKLDQIVPKADHVFMEIKRDLGLRSFRVDRIIM